MKINLHIHLTCEHCGKESLLDLKGANMKALRAAIASMPSSGRETSSTGAERPWAQEFLEKLFTWAPFGTWIEASSVPENLLTPYFTGANPRAQFGLWMTHYSRRPLEDGTWYVKRNKPNESAAEYIVRFNGDCDKWPDIYRDKYDWFESVGERI